MSQLSAARAATGLLDRDAQLARLGALLEDGRAGRGGLVVVEGPPGIGKSRLLAAARAMAAGFTVLTARAGELERDFPWGVVRQLFESTVLLVESAERAELLAGAAATAAEPLGLGGSRGRIETYAALHGLYWLAVNLATRDPLLLCVDDVQWADPPSVRFLQHLVTRIEDLPLLVVAAQRAHPAHPAVDLAADLPPDDVIRLDPLSDTAVAALVTDRLGPAEPGFLRACHHATGGNPFLVGELVAGLHRRGVAPRDHDIAEVTELGPHSVARAVLRRVQRLSPDAAALARAVAVLGTDVALRHAASLAELEPLAALAAADALAAVDVLRPGEPFDFVHPMVRSAVRDAIPAGARAGLHLHAAGLLRSDRAAPGRIAVHLLATPPTGQDWVVETLCAAADGAFGRGAPDAATAFLRRALAEPPAPTALASVHRRLGRAALLAGDPTGAEHYRAALSATDEPAERAAMARELGVLQVPAGEYREAVDVLELAVREADAARDPELARLALADLIGVGRLHPDTLPGSLARAAAVDPALVEPTPSGRALLGTLAMHGLAAGWSLAAVTDVAGRATAAGPPTDPAGLNATWDTGFALTMADATEAAEGWWQSVLTIAREHGSVLSYARCSCFLALAALHRGDLRAAEGHARSALDTAAGQPWNLRRMTTGILIETLLDRGVPDEAHNALVAVDGADDLPDGLMVNFLLLARGRLRVAVGQLEAGLADLHTYGRRPGAPFRDNPAVRAWRCLAATVESALGRRDEALRLAAEELDLARRVGSDRATGIALRTLGAIEGGERGEDLLTQAVTVLARSPARLEHARSLVELGAALRRRGRPTAARGPLRTGLDLAERCGARVLADHALTELHAAGARPRRRATTGIDALTASERRIARMAADGMSNRDIAQALYVTLRTVEVHLTHAYAKLGITSRGGLPAILGG